MEIPEIQVITLDQELIPLRLRLKDVVLALEKDGCVVLKGATDLTTIPPFIGKAPLEGILSSVEKNIVVNRVRLLTITGDTADEYLRLLKQSSSQQSATIFVSPTTVLISLCPAKDIRGWGVMRKGSLLAQHLDL